ncbi:MAG: fructose-bisphosphatase class III [Phycisphaeraceae bacterium]|nr:fructose-bisphosphatase class III [Phycisphaeraceae bacterium]
MPQPQKNVTPPDAAADRQALLQALSRQYPTVESAVAEAAGLRATLDLPMGLVHVISDIHGEDEKLRHVIHNGSGALRPLVERVLADRLSPEERQRFLAILYYPREALGAMSPGLVASGERTAWVHRTLGLQCEIIRALRKTYRRERVERLTPPHYRELFVEMLSGQRPEFPRAMLEHMARFDRDWGAIREASRLIRHLASAEIIVAGDLGDRGPRIDRVIDILMRQPRVSLLWGNHDAIWMGASLGHEPCLLTVLRFSARYRRAAQLEEGYGILTTPLEKLVRDCYGDDPAERFVPKGEGIRDQLTVARMQKALAIMQFKSEGQMFARRPEWGLEHRRLLHRIDFKAGTITLDGVAHRLLDTHLPTVDPRDPYAFNDAERRCLDLIADSFRRSQKLRDHMRWLVRRGHMWTRRDDVLVFHACVPVDDAGTPLPLNVDGAEHSGRSLMDALASVVRRAFRKGPFRADEDADWLWYLWGGPRSPLFGKDRLATFETHFIEDKATHKEKKNPYFELMHDEAFIRRIGALFGCGDDVLIVNGHVPVKVEKGERPVKRGGNAVTIDGAFSEAYGDRGYTLVLKPDRVDLAEHAPFPGVERVIASGADIVPTIQTIKIYPRPRRVRDVEEGRRVQRMIDTLESLAAAYQEGTLDESRDP